jgi:multiple sugar transport system substrate-binding protein
VGAETPPSIFSADAEVAYQVDKLGYACDIKQYFDEDLAEDVPNFIDEGNFSGDDTLKIFPMAKSTEVMILNSTDWQPFADATGVTTDDLSTWEGLANVAELYYNYTDDLTPDTPNDGKSFFGRDSSANYMVVGAKQLGYEYVTQDEAGNNVVNIDESALRKLWDNYYVPYVKGYYGSQSKFRSDDAKIGKIIALIGSTTGSAYYPTSVTIDDDYTYPIESLVLPVPNFEGYDPYVVQQGAGFVVTKSDEKTEYASTVFLKWYTDTDRNIESTIPSGYLPVKTEALDYDTITQVNSTLESPADGILLDTIKVAIDEINTSTLYASKPYDHCADVRDYLETAIYTNAMSVYDEVCERIANGEDRETVLEEYTNDEAFQVWLDDFTTNLESIASAE